ncbi:MAG: hypothetical protein DHS20C11_05240 [Lysobacteraceae bacterium]|nr:MAG: hypothetical protein DHS20C11_05240 [Xanthomonadaceae bacterium]
MLSEFGDLSSKGCALAYVNCIDKPSHEEVAELVNVGQKVLLVTDVIGTGGFVRDMIDCVERNGAIVSGILCMVDGRSHPERVESEVGPFGYGAEEYTLYRCATIPDSPTSISPTAHGKVYISDPVTYAPKAVSSDHADEGFPRSLESSIRLLEEHAHAIFCGHCRTGGKSTPLRIDTDALVIAAAERIAEDVRKLMSDVRDLTDWKDFQPGAIVFPRLGGRTGKIDSWIGESEYVRLVSKVTSIKNRISESSWTSSLWEFSPNC